jgi:hypothetical protein
MSGQGVLHRGSERYVIAARGSAAAGERLRFPDRESARAFIASLAAEPGNREWLRAAATGALFLGVPMSFGGRPDEAEGTRLTEGLARGWLEVVRMIDHPISPCTVTTTGTLTLSEVSWGETSGIYPTSGNLYKPDKWNQEKMCELLRARAAVNDVAKRNSHVRKAKPGNGSIEKMMRPYHCTENFPTPDKEIDGEVKWFYLSSYSDKPITHPGASQRMVIVKTYGPFHNIGGGDVAKGDVWLHFYMIAPKR